MNYVPHLDPDGPRHLALADAVVRDIRAGRLTAGASLPGVRQLAQTLGLNRNTVSRGFRELSAQGWIVTQRGRGTHVAPELPEEPAPPRSPSVLAGFRLPPRRVPRLPLDDDARYRFMAGHPDLRLLPLTELSRAYRRALQGRGRALVDYGDPQGSMSLRTELARWLAAQRSLSVGPDRLLITRGAQQALYLAAHTLFRPGDKVAVEAYGYRPAWAALQTAGATLVPVEVDADGLVVEHLADIPDLRGVYVTPHHQYPTGAMLSAARRATLLDQARRRRFAILEDDYDHEFHWRGHPVAPLAANDPFGVVVYFGTLSKAFAPGLRLGWISAPGDAVTRMTALRRLIDRQGDRVVEHAVAELIRDGELQRHIRRMHRVYRQRRAALLDAIDAHLPDLQTTDPAGGLGIWCEAPGIDVAELRRASRERDVLFQIGADVRMQPGPDPHLRLGFPSLEPAEIDEGIARIASGLAALRDRTRAAPTFSRALPGSSSETFELRTADGPRVQKTYRSDRAFSQARDALTRHAPDRIVGMADRTLLLRFLPGGAAPMSAQAHAAAARWLREYQQPASDPMPLAEAYAARLDRARENAATLGLSEVLDPIEPTRFDTPRVHCHRDFTPDNWVWDGTRLEVIDFEHARGDHPLVDLVKLATEVWPAHPELERAFLDAYGPIDRAVLDDLIRLHAVNTAVWAERHDDAAFRALARRLLARF